MSKRSIRKVRHYAPTPTLTECVLAGQQKNGKPGINLMEQWKQNVPRYHYQTLEETGEVAQPANGDAASSDQSSP